MSEIRRIRFERGDVDRAAGETEHLSNWPVVYVLDGRRKLYVGETVSAHKRMRQHLKSPKKHAGLDSIRVIIDDRFNKSVCLDLESHLIRWFHGDGRFDILNGNDGLTDAQYFDREI